jgi:hypothetical protein
MVSVDYDGTSNPENATWTVLEGDFLPQRVHLNNHNSSTYKHIKPITPILLGFMNRLVLDLDLIVQEWTLDDVRIANETFIASNPNLNFGG